MAVLNKIRQRSLILILVIALALFSFIIGDLFKNSNAFSGGAQDVVATINGEDISRNDFMQKVTNYQNRVGANQSSNQVMNTIYNQELRKIVLQTEFDALKLSVEKDEIRDLLKNSFSSYPDFQDENGVFDVNRLNAFIANLKDIQPEPVPLGNVQVNYESWANNEQAIAANAIQQSYFNLIKAGMITTISEAEDEYLGEAKTVDISFVQIPYTSIADSLVEVSKSDISNYIKENKEKYKVDASRKLVYVAFKEEASKEDEDALFNGLLALKDDSVEYNNSTKNTDTIPGFDNTTNTVAFVNANSELRFDDAYLRKSQLPVGVRDSLMNLKKGAYFGPYKDNGYYKFSKLMDSKVMADSVKVRHILIPFIGSNRPNNLALKTRKEAEATADSITQVLQKNPSKFKDFLKFSADKVSNENDGVIEFAYNSQFAPEFSYFSFNNNKGTIDFIETDFGFHVIEILDLSNFSETVQLATISKKIEPSEKTLQDVFNKMSKFEIAAKDGDFSALAKDLNLTAKPITVKELDENIPGLGSQRDIVKWAFNDDTKINDFKNFPISGFGFVVVKLEEKKDKGLMVAEDASITALPELRKQKKAKLIKDKITAATLADIAKNQGQTVRTAAAVTLNNTTLSGAGVEPRVVGAAFGLTEGATSKPIEGEKGVYVIKVAKINEATALDNYTPIINRLNSTLKSNVQGRAYKALENAAEIEDNRAKTVY